VLDSLVVLDSLLFLDSLLVYLLNPLREWFWLGFLELIKYWEDDYGMIYLRVDQFWSFLKWPFLKNLWIRTDN